MPEVDKAIPRLVLVDGDPILGMDAVNLMKRQWIESNGGVIQWVEASPPVGRKGPGEFLNYLDGEVATPDFGGDRKVIFLRGLHNSKQFAEALEKICSVVADGNTLVVFDEDGVIRGNGKKDGWNSLKAKFENEGTIAKVPPPFKDCGEVQWGERFGDGHVKAVVSAMEKRGKKISASVVREVFLERVLLDWSYILVELDKLADLVEGDTVTEDDVTSIVFPWAPTHGVFEFAKALNSGNFNWTMESYDQLMASKIPFEVVFSFCMKLLRWQLIAAHLHSYGQPLPSALVAIAGKMNREDAAKSTEKLRSLKPRMFKVPSKKTENKEEHKDEGITTFVATGVCEYVKKVLPSRVPVNSGALGSHPFVDAAMSRYLAMVTCMENVRFGGPESARREFRQTMFKVCGKGK